MKNQLLNNECSVNKVCCEWQNGNICSICGDDVANIKECPYGHEVYEGYVAWDDKHKNYIIVKEVREDFNEYEFNDLSIFTNDNLMKYNGKKLKIKLEVI